MEIFCQSNGWKLLIKKVICKHKDPMGHVKFPWNFFIILNLGGGKENELLLNIDLMLCSLQKLDLDARTHFRQMNFMLRNLN